jgi:hypothetical protein
MFRLENITDYYEHFNYVTYAEVCKKVRERGALSQHRRRVP